MKSIYLSFTELEFLALKKKKGNQSWREFVLGLMSQTELLKQEKEELLIKQLMDKGLTRGEAIEGLAKERQRIKEEENKVDIKEVEEVFNGLSV